MTTWITAIFENGVLRPLRPLVGVPDRAEVDITVNTRENGPAVVDSLGWRGCVGTISDSDAAEMSRAVDDEFEKVDDREW